MLSLLRRIFLIDILKGLWVTLKYTWMNNDREYTSAQRAAGTTDPDDDMQAAFIAVKF